MDDLFVGDLADVGINFERLTLPSLFPPSPAPSRPLLYRPRTHVLNSALEAIVSGRADGSAGPTVTSFCTALVKTGGSGILMWAFFHGLKQMSAPEPTVGEAAGLPVVMDGDVGTLT